MSNSNQEIIEAKLATYIDGDLDADERLEIETHLEQNPHYRRVLEELRNCREMLRGLPRESAPPELAEAFTNQLERSALLTGEEAASTPRMRIGFGSQMYAAAAIVLLTVGLAAIVMFVLPDRRGKTVVINNVKPPAVAPHSPTTESDEPTDDEKQAELEEERARAAVAEKGKAAVNSAREKASPDAAMARNDGAPASPEQAAGEVRERRANNADRDLDQLSLDISRDTQLKALLDNGDAIPSANGAPGSKDAMVMVVRSSNPDQLRTELNKFFARRNIEWEVAPEIVETALNNSLAQQRGQVAMNDDESQRRAELKDAGAKRELQQQRRRLTDTPAADVRVGNDAISHDAEPNPGGAMQPRMAAPSAPVAKATGEVRNATAATEPASAAPPTALAPRSPKAADIAAGQPSRGAAAPSPDSLTSGLPAKPIDTLYVVRRLSRRQAAELSACLADNGKLHQSSRYRNTDAPDDGTKFAQANDFKKTDALRKQAEQAIKGQAPAAADRVEVAGSPAAAPAPAGVGQDKSEAANKRAAGRLGAPVTQPASAIVRKGDELELRFAATDKDTPAASETVKVKEDGTIAPEAFGERPPVQVAGKSVAEVQHALQLADPRPEAAKEPPSVKVSRAVTEGEGGGAGIANNAPTEKEDLDALVNVVIVVQKDATVPANANFGASKAAGPTTAPATQPAGE